MVLAADAKLILNSPDIEKWLEYFFEPTASLQLVSESENVHFEQHEKAYITPADQEVCNNSNTYCFILALNYEIVENIRGEKVLEKLDPDSFVYLKENKSSSLFQIQKYGSDSTIHGACWLNDDLGVVYGLHNGAGFITSLNLGLLTEHFYTIQNCRMNKNADENHFLIEKYK